MENEITRLLVYEMSEDDFAQFVSFINSVGALDNDTLTHFQRIREELCSCSSARQVKTWFKRKEKEGWRSVLENYNLLLSQYILISAMQDKTTPPS